MAQPPKSLSLKKSESKGNSGFLLRGGIDALGTTPENPLWEMPQLSSPAGKPTFVKSISTPRKEDLAMPEEEKYFEKYLDSRLTNIERVVQDQSTRMEENLKQHKDMIEVLVTNLNENVKGAVTASAAITKEVTENNRWWNRLLVGSILTVMALFAGMLYFMSNVSSTVSRETMELRKESLALRQDLQNFQHHYMAIVPQPGKQTQ